MLVRNLKVHNFKSFRDIDVDLDRLNVIVGANASGKSNFVDVFRFLNGLAREGVAGSKLSLRPEYLRYVRLGASEPLRLSVDSDRTYEGRSASIATGAGLEISTFGTKYSYAFNGAGSHEFQEEISHEVLLTRAGGDEAVDAGKPWRGTIQIKGGAGTLVYSPDVLPIEPSIRTENIFEPFFRPSSEKARGSLIGGNPLYFFMQGLLDKIGVYDIDPVECQNADPATGTAILEEDGENLPLALKAILDDEDDKRKLYNLVREMLPFVSGVAIEKSADDIFLLKLSEVYARDHFLPAYLLSDGTLSLIAHLVVLYFMQDELVVIEEPDRHMHPLLASRLVGILEDVSSFKQVIITTHDPAIVGLVQATDIFLLSRDKDGFSKVSKPADTEEVRRFLEHELGMADLFLQGLLGD
jgi:predicted ATPase